MSNEIIKSESLSISENPEYAFLKKNFGDIKYDFTINVENNNVMLKTIDVISDKFILSLGIGKKEINMFDLYGNEVIIFEDSEIQTNIDVFCLSTDEKYLFISSGNKVLMFDIGSRQKIRSFNSIMLNSEIMWCTFDDYFLISANLSNNKAEYFEISTGKGYKFEKENIFFFLLGFLKYYTSEYERNCEDKNTQISKNKIISKIFSLNMEMDGQYNFTTEEEFIDNFGNIEKPDSIIPFLNFMVTSEKNNDENISESFLTILFSFFRSEYERKRNQPVIIKDQRKGWITAFTFYKKYFFTGGICHDNDILMWNDSGKIINKLKGHTKRITSLVSTKTKLFSSSLDCIKIWDINTCALLVTIYYINHGYLWVTHPDEFGNKWFWSDRDDLFTVFISNGNEKIFLLEDSPERKAYINQQNNKEMVINRIFNKIDYKNEIQKEIFLKDINTYRNISSKSTNNHILFLEKRADS